MLDFSEFRRAHVAKSTLFTSQKGPLGSFRIFKVCSDANERVGAESNGKLAHLSIPSKAAAWVPEFAVEDLPLSRPATLVPEVAVKNLSLGRTP